MARVPPTLRRSAARLRTQFRDHLATYAPHLLVLTAGLVIYLVATGLFPYHSANHDEGVYLQQAAMLLDGQLALHPPVEDAFRPWFFVEDGDTLYPKYAPVPAAMFAIGVAFGNPRLVLALIGAALVGLTYAIATELFDRSTGLLAGALLLTSPLFVLDTATFLPYAPTTALNLTFAYAYLRAERDTGTPTHWTRWAALAGLAIGLAFFARPYTAVLFATPFIGHALLTFVRAGNGSAITPLRRRRLVTAGFGLLGVAFTLAYNWALTGHPFVFPYQAFAPLDGLGFGQREILGHGIQYTPELALRVTRMVLQTYLTDWAPLGLLGSVLAAGGIWAVRRSGDWRHAVIAGVFVSVALGNGYFWGNFNILGNLQVGGDGLISLLGPYYHFDLLLPTAVFAAAGIRNIGRTVTQRVHQRVTAPQARVLLSAILVVALVFAGGVAATTFEAPVERNADVTAEYERAYEPFEGAGGPPDDAVVFLPEPYGPWLNHPFQVLRNDPGYDQSTIYALPENEFDVVDAFPERSFYRYAYRGTWNPFDGSRVTARLQPVAVERAPRVTVDATVETPPTASSISIRLATDESQAYYAAPASGTNQTLGLHVDGARAWVTGDSVEPTGNGTIPIDERDTIELTVNVNTEGGGYTYRLEVPVSTAPSGDRRVLTPRLEVCTVPQLCGGEAAYLPGPDGSGYELKVALHPTPENVTRPES